MDMRLLAMQRTRPEDLDRLRVRATGTGTTTIASTANTTTALLVPLSSVTISVEEAELQTINHANRQRAIRITGNVGPGHSQSEALDYARTLAADVPPGYSLVLSGQSSQFGDAMKSFFFAWIVGLIFAYMVLASQFNSLLHPITVLTILPLSLAGAMVTLLITGKTLNVFSMIGLLLADGHRQEELDHPRRLRERGPSQGRPQRHRCDEGCRPRTPAADPDDRDRDPDGRHPSALGLGPGAETRGPMADAIIGGLILSTVLSLFVVPAFYVLSDQIFGGPNKPPKATAVAEPHVAEPPPP